MATILNQEDLHTYQTGLEYHRMYHADPKYTPSNIEMLSDNSSMDKDIEEQFFTLSYGAKKLMKKRSKDTEFYDWKTSNKSFLKVYDELYNMGVKNNKFFLRLFDKDLQGVNVYQKVLPVEIQVKIIFECMVNPWYWLREVCRIPQDGRAIEPGGGVQFILDRNNLACWYLMLNSIPFYQSKPRQCGKTQNALAIQNYAFHFGTTSATFLFFNKDQALAKTNLYRFKCQRDLLPVWMQMRTVFTEEGKLDKGTENITSMRNPVTKNTIKVMPAATSHDAAMRLGRGETAAWHYMDEMDFIKFGQDIMDSAAFSYATANKNALDNGGLSCRIFTSTPGDANSKEGQETNEWIDGMFKWKDKYFDMPIQKLKKHIFAPKRTHVVFVEHSWKELGKTMKWYEEQCGLVKFKEDVILREIDLKRIPGTGLSPFTKSQLMYMTRHTKEPLLEDDMSNNLCPWLIYEQLHRGYPYILSCDPADGLSGDNYAITLINPYTLGVSAEFKTPYISQTGMAKIIEKFMDKYCPNALIIVENNKGRETIHRLQETKYASQLWYDIDKLNAQLIDSRDEYGALKAASMEDRAMGLTTSTRTRPRYFAILQELVEENIDVLYGKHIVKDILGLIRKPGSGKIEAGPGGNHDDNILSYLMGLYVYRNASNLEQWGLRYGMTIPAAIVATDDPVTVKNKLKGMISLLPESMKEVFRTVVEEKDSIEESWKYQRELDRIRKLEESERQSLRSNEKSFDPNINEDIWRNLDKAVLESNDDYNSRYDVNLNDWI